MAKKKSVKLKKEQITDELAAFLVGAKAKRNGKSIDEAKEDLRKYFQREHKGFGEKS